MKKIIALLLSLSLLLCMNALVYAAEGDDSSNEPIVTVGDISETAAELSTEGKTSLTEEPADTETAEPVEKSTAPENTVSTVDSETSQEPAGTVPDGGMQPTDEDTPAGDMAMTEPMPVSTNCVTITWKGLVFTYHEATNGTWNPNAEGGAAWENPKPAHWSSSDSDNSDCGTITIQNNITEPDTILATVKFTPNDRFASYSIGLAISENKGDVTVDKPINDNMYWSPTKTKDLVISKEESKTIYVRPGVSTNTLSNVLFTGMTEDSPLLLGNITIEISVDVHDPESPDQPGME